MVSLKKPAKDDSVIILSVYSLFSLCPVHVAITVPAPLVLSRLKAQLHLEALPEDLPRLGLVGVVQLLPGHSQGFIIMISKLSDYSNEWTVKLHGILKVSS